MKIDVENRLKVLVDRYNRMNNGNKNTKSPGVKKKTLRQIKHLCNLGGFKYVYEDSGKLVVEFGNTEVAETPVVEQKTTIEETQTTATPKDIQETIEYAVNTTANLLNKNIEIMAKKDEQETEEPLGEAVPEERSTCAVVDATISEEDQNAVKAAMDTTTDLVNENKVTEETKSILTEEEASKYVPGTMVFEEIPQDAEESAEETVEE